MIKNTPSIPSTEKSLPKIIKERSKENYNAEVRNLVQLTNSTIPFKHQKHLPPLKTIKEHTAPKQKIHTYHPRMSPEALP